MKAYVLVGFIVLVIVVLAIISGKQREHMFGVTSVPDINNRLTNMENKIAESDKKRSESEGEINSTRR
jgi:hypothetical protein